MAKVLFIGKDTSVSQTIYGLIDQIDGVELSSKWLDDMELDQDEFSANDLCILNLSDWESGNMNVIKKLSSALPERTQLLVIDTYKDQHLIDKILDLGAAAYVEQQRVASTIETNIHQLLMNR
jgi:DNA-binding NarL/FixJ family response regulator